MRDDLSIIRGKRILVIEDDVASGGTLQIVSKALR
jgi:adenine/guanine phosphoribosyltransferase-like PRPP-binding protein